MQLTRDLARIALMLAVLGGAGSALARQDPSPELQPPPSRTEASQIAMPAAAGREGGSKAYLDTGHSPTPTLHPTSEPDSEQISRGDGKAPTSQISARGQGGSGMAQLSRADLEATLAQLSVAERRVLLQAIEGTDICDNPPDIAAIMALCRNRLETRSQEFATLADRPVSAEEHLLRGDLDNQAGPSIGQVIERLARGNAATDDFSNQAIASIALTGPGVANARGKDETAPDTSGLGQETQALINALINQLGGRAP
jgi:hypothetical protein